jgi:flagellar basal-body rod modification protein FlgD
MTTSAINSAAGNAVGSAVSSLTGTGGKNELGQDAFLKLMLSQMKNQDPFKPQDPSAFIGQLAQFSTVSGIQAMQGNISTLSDALRSSQVLDGTTLVGHDVLSVSSSATLGETGSVKGSVTIPQGTSQAAIAVTDASGQLVRRLPLSSQQGETGFVWDGTTDRGTRAPAGNYTFAAVANVGGAAEQLQTQISSRVGSVTIDPTNYSLTLNTDLGPIALANVRRVM